MKIALEDLKLEHLNVVFPGTRTFSLAERITAVGLGSLQRKLAPLRGH